MRNELTVIGLVLLLLLAVSCQAQSAHEMESIVSATAVSITTVTAPTTPAETTTPLPMITTEEVEALIANGGTLDDLLALMGNDYKECGSGAWILEWELADGTYLQTWINNEDISGFRISSETLYRDYSHLFTTHTVTTNVPQ